MAEMNLVVLSMEEWVGTEVEAEWERVEVDMEVVVTVEVETIVVENLGQECLTRSN